MLREFVSDHELKTLDVAGPRASKEPEVAAFVKEVLGLALLAAGQPDHRRPRHGIVGPGRGRPSQRPGSLHARTAAAGLGNHPGSPGRCALPPGGLGEITLEDFAAFDKAGLTDPDLSRMNQALRAFSSSARNFGI